MFVQMLQLATVSPVFVQFTVKEKLAVLDEFIEPVIGVIWFIVTALTKRSASEKIKIDDKTKTKFILA